MLELHITIRFLDARYHGCVDGGQPEWPPSPMRLYQALLAVAKPQWSDAMAAAFNWLEKTAPPIIQAPHADTGQTRLTYVPNNNSDSPAQQRTAKTITPTLIQGKPVLHYRWAVNVSDESHAQQIAQAANHIRALGWGIDLAIARGQVTNQPAPATEPDLVIWQPAPIANLHTGGPPLRIPCQGSLKSLEEAYATSLARVSDKQINDVPGKAVFKVTCYSQAGMLRPNVVFSLKTAVTDGTPPRLRPQQIKSLVGMIRSLASSPRIVNELGQDIVNCSVLGHVPEQIFPEDEPRLSILPLPSVGHAYSDGLFRNVLLLETPGLHPTLGDKRHHPPGQLIKTLANLLQGQTLRPENSDEPATIQLERMDYRSAMVKNYTAKSKTWTSATPVLLPGYDDRKQHRNDHQKRLARATSLFKKALRHSGIDQSCQFDFSHVPFVPGTRHVRDYQPRLKLAHYPRYHVRVVFEQDFTGPWSLGAGRHVGFGTMVAF